MDKEFLLAFDFGIKEIGVAVGQKMTKSATPLKALQAKKGTPDWSLIEKIRNKWDIGAFVVGMPYNMDGTEQPITEKVKNFGKKLQAIFNTPVYFMDERLTTKEARWMIRQAYRDRDIQQLKQASVDSLAAKIILESFFRLKRRGGIRE
jgi:putative Holliday junction resolvase